LKLTFHQFNGPFIGQVNVLSILRILVLAFQRFNEPFADLVDLDVNLSSI